MARPNTRGAGQDRNREIYNQYRYAQIASRYGQPTKIQVTPMMRASNPNISDAKPCLVLYNITQKVNNIGLREYTMNKISEVAGSELEIPAGAMRF